MFVFVRLLCINQSVGRPESKKTGSQVIYSNVIAHLLRNLKFVIKRSRNMCAMTGLNIQTLPWKRDYQRSRSLEGKLLSVGHTQNNLFAGYARRKQHDLRQLFLSSYPLNRLIRLFPVVFHLQLRQ